LKRPLTVFATANPGKLDEVAPLLTEVTELRRLSDYPSVPAPQENRSTFKANARAKALAYARLLAPYLPADGLVLAEDAGLEVFSLDGYPGVRSSRVAFSDERRMALVLARLRARGYADEDSRGARFVSVMSLVRREYLLAEAEGEVRGIIAPEPRGHRGFGYDPLFFFPPYGKTFGECSLEEKRAVSHRSMALSAIVEFIRENLLEES